MKQSNSEGRDGDQVNCYAANFIDEPFPSLLESAKPEPSESNDEFSLPQDEAFSADLSPSGQTVLTVDSSGVNPLKETATGHDGGGFLCGTETEAVGRTACGSDPPELIGLIMNESPYPSSEGPIPPSNGSELRCYATAHNKRERGFCLYDLSRPLFVSGRTTPRSSAKRRKKSSNYDKQSFVGGSAAVKPPTVVAPNLSAKLATVDADVHPLDFLNLPGSCEDVKTPEAYWDSTAPFFHPLDDRWLQILHPRSLDAHPSPRQKVSDHPNLHYIWRWALVDLLDWNFIETLGASSSGGHLVNARRSPRRQKQTAKRSAITSTSAAADFTNSFASSLDGVQNFGITEAHRCYRERTTVANPYHSSALTLLSGGSGLEGGDDQLMANPHGLEIEEQMRITSLERIAAESDELMSSLRSIVTASLPAEQIRFKSLKVQNVIYLHAIRDAVLRLNRIHLIDSMEEVVTSLVDNNNEWLVTFDDSEALRAAWLSSEQLHGLLKERYQTSESKYDLFYEENRLQVRTIGRENHITNSGRCPNGDNVVTDTKWPNPAEAAAAAAVAMQQRLLLQRSAEKHQTIEERSESIRQKIRRIKYRTGPFCHYCRRHITAGGLDGFSRCPIRGKEPEQRMATTAPGQLSWISLKCGVTMEDYYKVLPRYEADILKAYPSRHVRSYEPRPDLHSNERPKAVVDKPQLIDRRAKRVVVKVRRNIAELGHFDRDFAKTLLEKFPKEVKEQAFAELEEFERFFATKIDIPRDHQPEQTSALPTIGHSSDISLLERTEIDFADGAQGQSEERQRTAPNNTYSRQPLDSAGCSEACEAITSNGPTRFGSCRPQRIVQHNGEPINPNIAGETNHITIPQTARRRSSRRKCGVTDRQRSVDGRTTIVTANGDSAVNNGRNPAEVKMEKSKKDADGVSVCTAGTKESDSWWSRDRIVNIDPTNVLSKTVAQCPPCCWRMFCGECLLNVFQKQVRSKYETNGSIPAYYCPYCANRNNVKAKHTKNIDRCVCDRCTRLQTIRRLRDLYCRLGGTDSDVLCQIEAPGREVPWPEFLSLPEARKSYLAQFNIRSAASSTFDLSWLWWKKRISAAAIRSPNNFDPREVQSDVIASALDTLHSLQANRDADAAAFFFRVLRILFQSATECLSLLPDETLFGRGDESAVPTNLPPQKRKRIVLYLQTHFKKRLNATQRMKCKSLKLSRVVITPRTALPDMIRNQASPTIRPRRSTSDSLLKDFLDFDESSPSVAGSDSMVKRKSTTSTVTGRHRSGKAEKPVLVNEVEETSRPINRPPHDSSPIHAQIMSSSMEVEDDAPKIRTSELIRLLQPEEIKLAYYKILYPTESKDTIDHSDFDNALRIKHLLDRRYHHCSILMEALKQECSSSYGAVRNLSNKLSVQPLSQLLAEIRSQNYSKANVEQIRSSLPHLHCVTGKQLNGERLIEECRRYAFFLQRFPAFIKTQHIESCLQLSDHISGKPFELTASKLLPQSPQCATAGRAERPLVYDVNSVGLTNQPGGLPAGWAYSTASQSSVPKHHRSDVVPCGNERSGANAEYNQRQQRFLQAKCGEAPLHSLPFSLRGNYHSPSNGDLSQRYPPTVFPPWQMPTERHQWAPEVCYLRM